MELPKANRVAVAISMISIVAMVINNEIFKVRANLNNACSQVLINLILQPLLAKRTKIPFPIELLAVVLGTLASWLFTLNESYSVTIVGDIPAGYVIRIGLR